MRSLLCALLFSAAVASTAAAQIIVYSREKHDPAPPPSTQPIPADAYWEESQPRLPVVSPSQNQVMISSGTGFFVSNQGHAVTNAHVVKGCSNVMIRGATDPMLAEVVAVNEQNDLALLKADTIPPRIASIRRESDRLKIGEQLVILGYPEESGITGEYKTVYSSIVDMRGPNNEPEWIQFADSVQHGNSGGPLLDASGNVVGVVTGIAESTRFNPRSGKHELASRTNFAVSLPVLREFLHKNHVYFRAMDSRGVYSAPRIQSQAESFVVNIHCRMPAASQAHGIR